MISLEKVSRFLILAFPITIISIKVLGPLIYVLLALIGIYLAVSKRVLPFSLKELQVFSWLTIGYFSVMVLSVVLSSEPSNNWIHLSRKAQFLIAPFVGLTLYYSNIDIVKVLKYLKITVIVLSILVIGQYTVDMSFTRFSHRYSGMFNPNTFGDILVIMIFISTSYLNQEKTKEYLGTLIMVSFGAMAVVLTGSRASMLTYLGLMAILVLLNILDRSSNKRRVFMVLASGLLSLILSFAIFSNTSKRLSLAEQQVIQWSEGKALASSVGARLEMYQSGVSSFLDSPWVGYGYRNANAVASRYAREEAKEYIASMSHLHNEYLTNAVNAGILGLSVLLALFLVPLRKFIHLYILRKSQYAMAGVFLVCGFMLNGIFHASLQWEYQNSFFSFFLVLFLLKISGKHPNAKLI